MDLHEGERSVGSTAKGKGEGRLILSSKGSLKGERSHIRREGEGEVNPFFKGFHKGGEVTHQKGGGRGSQSGRIRV